MKKQKWIKWVVGAVSVTSFTGLIGYLNQQDKEEPADLLTDQIETGLQSTSWDQPQMVEASDPLPDLDWETGSFDSPDEESSQIITLDDAAVPFNEEVLTDVTDAGSAIEIVASQPVREVQPSATRKTRTRAS